MRVGIVGGGQLARMMALAGHPLGLQFTVLDPARDACAGAVADLIVAPFDDVAALKALAQNCDVITFDFENVSVSALEQLDQAMVRPNPGMLAVAQDRLAEKQMFARLGIPTAPYAAPDAKLDLSGALQETGMPAIIKTRRMGYDGKGQLRIQSADDAETAAGSLAGADVIVEGMVPFDRELSQVSVRSPTGEIRHYPLVENKHKDGILASTFAPARVTHQKQVAEEAAVAILEEFDYVGVLAIEFFEVEGRLVANEIAPRVHNSGHWSLDGAITSQFENHIRAILGWPLGACDAVGCTAMINWIGAMPNPSLGLGCDHTHWHSYAKAPRPGRKVGHTNICAATLPELHAKMASFALQLGEGLAREGGAAFDLSF